MNPCKLPRRASLTGSRAATIIARRCALLAAILAPAFPAAELAAQTDAERAADSLVRADDRLFDLPSLPDLDSVRAAAPLPGGRRMKFPLLEDLLGDFLRLEDSYSIISYDRADGLYIGLGSDLPEQSFIEQRLQGWLTFGYAFGSHYWQVAGGLKRDFLSQSTPFRIGVEGHILTDTRDAWKMGPAENTFFSALAGIDARDYFQRRGFSVSAGQFITERIGLTLEYRNDSYRSSRREVGWSLFGPHQPFVEVPAVREGPLRSVALHLIADGMSRRGDELPHMAIEGIVERGIAGDDFWHYVLDGRAKLQVVPHTLGLNVRARIGGSSGDAPPQRRFTLGGLGSLPGYPQNGMEGNRMLLVQTEVVVAPFRSFPLRDLRLILENSLGAAESSDSAASAFTSLPGGRKHSIGLYLASANGRFRIGAAARTDVEASPVVIVRLSSPF